MNAFALNEPLQMPPDVAISNAGEPLPFYSIKGSSVFVIFF